TLFYIRRDEEAKKKCLNYFIIIFSFSLGALIGALLIKCLEIYAIWICCFILIVVVVLLLRKN
ncbi:MAG: DUF1275 family protein, partial [Turicibacter bilis]